MKKPTFLKSLTHAWDGVVFTVRTQRNARIHVVMGCVVLGLATWLQLDRLSLAVLVLTIGAVLAAETINTTVEALVDLLSPEFHDRAKIAKDVAAGAVLIVSLAAIVIGVLLLGPPLWQRLFSANT